MESTFTQQRDTIALILSLYKKNLFCTLICMLLNGSTWAQIEVDGIYYNLLKENKAEVTMSPNNYSGSVVIPSEIYFLGDYYTVFSIDKEAFYDCRRITSVNIPNSVTSIGDRAFSGCSNLSSLFIPKSVTSIGDLAFSGCSNLSSLFIPKSVTSIGDLAFSGCSDLSFIEVEAENTFYDSRNSCNAIIETETNILIVGCQNTVIPNSVTCIGEDAFHKCFGLTFVDIPNSVTSIRNYAFRDCTGLASVNIPNSVTTIGKSAFYGCSSLNTLVIPNSVTSIGDAAFSGCIGLNSLTIPNSVNSVGDCAFCDCSGLASIEVDCENSKYDSRNSCNAIIETKTNKLVVGCKNTTIPHSVTDIGDYAFCGCIGLSSVVIPNSVTSIGKDAFSGCKSLTSVVIPNKITSIGGFAFYGCNLLNDVFLLSQTPDILVDAMAFVSLSNSTLHVLPSCKSVFEAVEPWKKFTIIEDAIAAIDNMNVFGQDAVYYNLHGQRTRAVQGLRIKGGKKIFMLNPSLTQTIN